MLKLLKIKDETGNALILTVVIVSILTMLSAAFVNLITHDYNDTNRQRRWIQAYYIAEAGVAKAWFTLKNDVKGFGGNLGNIVIGADEVPGTSDDGALSFGPIVNFGAGSFSVVIADNNDEEPNNNFSDSDDILMLNSTGVVGNIRRTIEVALTALPFKPNDAVTINGDFKISGNPTIAGTHGSVRVNGNLTVSGSPNISQDVTVGGSADISSSSTIGGETSSGAATIAIPPVDPQFYRSNADYELRSNGDVFDSIGNLIASKDFNYWKWSSGKWRLSGNNKYDGTYYIEGNAEVAGSPGSDIDPWRVTIIATGNIDISGNPYMLPDTPDLLFVAGRDVEIGASSNQHYEGFILVHEQIKIHGTPTIEGSIIVENAENISDLCTENDIVGNATIGYDGTLDPPLPKIYSGQLGLLSWH